MDFYAHQATRRWQSALLLMAFVLVLLAIGALIHVLVTALSLFLGQGGSYAHPSTPAIAMISLVWLMMIAGCVFRLIDVKAGGAVLAQRFGAVQVVENSRHDNDRQLLNVVAEMSIASTMSHPDVFVLRSERSINAFILGNSASRPAIVLSQGALDAYDRDQLQAVVAHELAHVANGDLATNMRILVTLGGLMAIYEVGQLLTGDEDNDNVHPGVFVGGFLSALGTVGVIAGRLISAAFSRQREFLADASAVQYTRNPFAMAAALDIAREHVDEPALHGVHASELAHLCFQSGQTNHWLKKQRWLLRLLASHPDLALRIKAIEPHYHVKKRQRSRRDPVVATGNAGTVPFINNINEIQATGVNGDAGQASNAIQHSPVMMLSDRVVILLSDQQMGLAALFALFLHDNEYTRNIYLNALSSDFEESFVNDVIEIKSSIPEELANNQIAVISFICETLNNKISIEQRQNIMHKLEQLLITEDTYDLMDYARVQLIKRKLLITSSVHNTAEQLVSQPAASHKFKNFSSMGSDFALLLSLMVESSGASATQIDAHFKQVLKCYTQEIFPRRSADETGVVRELESAFQTLSEQPHSVRHAFVQHCIEIMEHDGCIMPAERALLDLFAASLGCDELIAA